MALDGVIRQPDGGVGRPHRKWQGRMVGARETEIARGCLSRNGCVCSVIRGGREQGPDGPRLDSKLAGDGGRHVAGLVLGEQRRRVGEEGDRGCRRMGVGQGWEMN